MSVERSGKVCTKCGEYKNLSEFHSNGTKSDGQPRLHSWCGDCQAAQTLDWRNRRLEEDPEALLERQRANTRRHREKTGNERGKRLSRATQAAQRALQAAHPREYERLRDLAYYEEFGEERPRRRGRD